MTLPSRERPYPTSEDPTKLHKATTHDRNKIRVHIVRTIYIKYNSTHFSFITFSETLFQSDFLDQTLEAAPREEKRRKREGKKKEGGKEYFILY
jgi:hypothetical protein